MKCNTLHQVKLNVFASSKMKSELFFTLIKETSLSLPKFWKTSIHRKSSSPKPAHSSRQRGTALPALKYQGPKNPLHTQPLALTTGTLAG